MGNDYPTQQSEQELGNQSFDKVTKVSAVIPVGYTGQGTQRQIGQIMAEKVTIDGSLIYTAKAAPGTDQADPHWSCQKTDTTDPNNIVTTWANGGRFNQTATDLTSLSYN